MADTVLTKAIENAVKAEELGITFYTDLAKKFEKAPELNQMFKLLAKDEVDHKKQFEAILSSVDTGSIAGDETDKDFLEGIDISRYFEGMGKVDTALTPKEVLMNAYNFEKETVLYYIMIKDFIGGASELDEIIKIEKKHAMQLMKIITTDAKFRGMSDKWD